MRDCTICVVKIKAAQLICGFVFEYAKIWVSRDSTQFVQLYSNRSVQSHKKARSLKFRIYVNEGLDYLCSEKQRC